MEKFGCVTPFGYNKTNICTNTTLAKKAHEYYEQSFKTYSENCLNPCTYFLIDAIKLDAFNRTDKDTAYLQLSFQEYIKVTTAFYNSSMLKGKEMRYERNLVCIYAGIETNQLLPF